MFQRLPTVLWIAGTTLALGALTPVVGHYATSAPPAGPAADAAGPAAPGGQETPAADASADSAAPSEESSAAPDKGAVLVEEATTDVGPAAVGAGGRTLYRSDLDGHNPPVSVCVSAKCVKAWKPVYLPSADAKPVAGKGVDSSDLGSVLRSDGKWQATLGGWPLYVYIKDKAPGDALGEGVKGTWHVIAPDGKRAVDAEGQ